MAGDVLLGDSIYDISLNQYPRVRLFFETANVDRQAALLAMVLLVVDEFSTGDSPSADSQLTELGAVHRRWRAPSDLYSYFREAMLDALARRHADDWDAKLELDWQAAIDAATEQMRVGYENRLNGSTRQGSE
jgi:hemoglobin-like flavoprotein